MPASMDDEDKRHKQASRRDKVIALMATESSYLKEIIDDALDRPEEVCRLCYLFYFSS